MTIRVGVFGLGTIGRQICRAVETGIPGVALAGGTGRDRATAEAFLTTLSSKPPFLAPEELIQASDLVIEAATQAALQEVAPKVLGAGKDLMVLSCGGLLGRSDWVELAQKNRCRILVPSGAIAGLDGVKGARVGPITSVTMESRKPPRGLAGAPYLEVKRINLDSIRAETLLFERTTIKIFAVPGLARNTHRIIVEGEFGRLDAQGRDLSISLLDLLPVLLEVPARSPSSTLRPR